MWNYKICVCAYIIEIYVCGFLILTEFDATDELGTSFDNMKLPPAGPSSSEYGAYLKQQKAACEYTHRTISTLYTP